MKKAERVFTQRHSDGFYPTCYPSDRRDMAISTDTPHRIIAEADLPTEKDWDAIMERYGWNKQTSFMEIAFAKFVLVELGLHMEGK